MILFKTETALGSNKIRVLDLFDNKDLVAKTGIEYVYQATVNTVSLALEACQKLEKHIDKRQIRLCIMVTQTPDDYLPANSITLANKFGLPVDCLAIDISQGCSGFVQALCLIDKLIKSYDNILLVTADRYRSKLNVADRSTNAVFSDGATATLCKRQDGFGIIYESHFTDGSKRNLLFQTVDKSENNGCLHMSGAEVWMFTRIKVVPQIIEAINYCKQHNLNIGGIYIHQASRVVVDGIKSLLPIEKEKVYENYDKFGNTVSSTIPFLIKDYPLNTKENTVDILAGFGVGLTSSVIIYGKKHHG